MFGLKQQREAFNQMKEALTEAVMKDIGQKLIDKSNENQEKINKEMSEKISKFQEVLRVEVKKVLVEEVTEKIREIVNEEINKEVKPL